MLALIVGGVGSCGDDHMSGGWWWVTGIGWLVFLAAVVVVTVALTRGHRPSGEPRRTAYDTLDDLFARGEIDADEYRKRRDTLRS